MHSLLLSPIDNATTLSSALACLASLSVMFLYLCGSFTWQKTSPTEPKGWERIVVCGSLVVWASALCAAMKLLTPFAITILGLSELEQHDPPMAFLAAFAAGSLIAMFTSRVIFWAIMAYWKGLRG